MRNNYTFKIFNSLVVLFIALSGCHDNKNINNSSIKTVKNEFSDSPGSYIVKVSSDEIIIPFELYAGNKPMIIGKINGKSVKFLIDNGKLWNDIWFYNGEVDSIDIHYKANEADSVIGIGKNNANLIFEGNQIKVDFEQIHFIDQPTLISPPEAEYANFFPGINGQVCGMLFKHFIVTFDFVNHKLILIKPENYAKSKKQYAVQMQKKENGSYCIPFEIITKDFVAHEILLDIDIGTVFPVYLISNRINGIPISLNAKKQLFGMGASGEIYGFTDTLKELRFSNFIFKDYLAYIVKEESNADKSIVENGTFGIELMKQFDVTFDYFNEIIYFKPNINFKGIESGF